MFVNIDLYHWADAEAPEGEAALRAHMKTSLPGVTPVVAGRAIQEASRRFNYGLVTKFDDFDAWDAWVADEDIASQWMTTPLASPRWLGLRVVAFSDEYLAEHGKDAWSHRAAQPVLALARTNAAYGRFLADRALRTIERGLTPSKPAARWLEELAGAQLKR
jgi:hypothetical protein